MVFALFVAHEVGGCYLRSKRSKKVGAEGLIRGRGDISGSRFSIGWNIPVCSAVVALRTRVSLGE